MTNLDYVQGFQRCKSEIQELRKTNNELAIEVNAMNRVLNAVNNHREPNGSSCMSEDIVYLIKKTEDDLKEKIKNDKINNDCKFTSG